MDTSLRKQPQSKDEQQSIEQNSPQSMDDDTTKDNFHLSEKEFKTYLQF